MRGLMLCAGWPIPVVNTPRPLHGRGTLEASKGLILLFRVARRVMPAQSMRPQQGGSQAEYGNAAHVASGYVLRDALRINGYTHARRTFLPRSHGLTTHRLPQLALHHGGAM